MRPIVLSVLAAFVLAAPVHATEEPARDAETKHELTAEPTPVLEATEVPVGEMRLEQVRVERTEVAEQQESAAQWPQRGSFWWLVGVVVVAGVILAVLL